MVVLCFKCCACFKMQTYSRDTCPRPAPVLTAHVPTQSHALPLCLRVVCTHLGRLPLLAYIQNAQFRECTRTKRDGGVCAQSNVGHKPGDHIVILASFLFMKPSVPSTGAFCCCSARAMCVFLLLQQLPSIRLNLPRLECSPSAQAPGGWRGVRFCGHCEGDGE